MSSQDLESTWLQTLARAENAQVEFTAAEKLHERMLQLIEEARVHFGSNINGFNEVEDFAKDVMFKAGRGKSLANLEVGFPGSHLMENSPSNRRYATQTHHSSLIIQGQEHLDLPEVALPEAQQNPWAFILDKLMAKGIPGLREINAVTGLQADTNQIFYPTNLPVRLVFRERWTEGFDFHRWSLIGINRMDFSPEPGAYQLTAPIL